MLPILQIGPLALPVPQFSLLIALWLGLSLSERLAPRYGLDSGSLYNLVFTGLIAGIAGARIGYVLQYPATFVQFPLSFLSLSPGMLDLFSGFVFALLGIFIYGKYSRLGILNTLDALTPLLAVLAIGLAVAHIASGEAFGSETNLPWAINLWGANRHPTQFYELIATALILGLILVRTRQAPPAGNLFLAFVALTATSQLFLEAFHGDSVTISGGFRTAQIIAWVILAVALIGLDIIDQNSLAKR
jgi:prolipoprotein diacylglyceryltransferase